MQQNESITAPSNNKSTLHKKIGLIQLGQLKRARQMIKSNGRTETTLQHVVEQMVREFSERKMEMPTPKNAKFNHQRATIDFEVTRNSITSLNPIVSAGLGRLRNEHLLTLLFNERSHSNPRTKQAFGYLCSLSKEIVTSSLSWSFYIACASTSLTVLNKMMPEDLEDRM